MSPPISDPARTSSRTRGSRTTARTAAAISCSPTSGIVSTEIRSPRMLCRSASDDRPERHLADLRAAADDDDALAVDERHRRRGRDVPDAFDAAKALDHRIDGVRQIAFEEDFGLRRDGGGCPHTGCRPRSR